VHPKSVRRGVSDLAAVVWVFFIMPDPSGIP
jgi:hypothetical protein